MSRFGRRHQLTITLGVLALSGCTGISIEPSCPNELRVGESGVVLANEQNTGAIARYFWEVIPPGVGRFTDPLAPSTTFEALAEGEAILRLTASDGLYQVISQCQTRVIAGEVEVALSADPRSPTVGDEVTLTCTSVGGAEAVSFVIDQLDGTPLDITPVSEGVATVSPDATGEYTFRCTGEDADGSRSDPAVLDVTIRPPREGPR